MLLIFHFPKINKKQNIEWINILKVNSFRFYRCQPPSQSRGQWATMFTRETIAIIKSASWGHIQTSGQCIEIDP